MIHHLNEITIFHGILKAFLSPQRKTYFDYIENMESVEEIPFEEYKEIEDF